MSKKTPQMKTSKTIIPPESKIRDGLHEFKLTRERVVTLHKSNNKPDQYGMRLMHKGMHAYYPLNRADLVRLHYELGKFVAETDSNFITETDIPL